MYDNNEKRSGDSPVPVLEYYPELTIGGKRPDKIILPPFRSGKTAICNPEDTIFFGGEADAGWCDSGFAVFARVTDMDFFNNNPVDKLWSGASVEVYFHSAGAEDFAVGDMLQIVVAPPDSDGECRFYCYGRNTEPAMKYVQCSGNCTEKGYDINVFVPWEALGSNAEKLIKRDGCRFNMAFNNNRGSVLTLNGKLNLTVQKEASPEFVLLKELSHDQQYDLTVRCKLSANGILAEPGKTFCTDMGMPCIAVFEDGNGNVLEKICSGNGRITFTPPQKGFFNLTVFIDDAECNKIIGRRKIFACDCGQLSQIMAAPGSPAQRVMAAGIINALNCFKSNTGCTDIVQEITVRQKQLAGEDISDAPGILRYLNLMGDPSGTVQTGISRCKVLGQCIFYQHSRACITVQWGGIPFLYGDVLIFDSPEEAMAEMRAAGFMRTALPAPQIAGTDQVYAGYGYSLGDALKSDWDPEHLVGIINREIPEIFGRAEPHQALNISPAAFVINPGASPEHIAVMRSAGLPEITMAEAGSVAGHVIVLGEEMRSADWHGIYFHPLYGTQDAVCLARKGNAVFRTSYSVPEIAVQALEAFAACKPIPLAVVEHWRKLKLDSLGGDMPELREAGRLIRTGEVHCHSNYSDGHATPGTILMEAVAGGMDFLILTDHNTTKGAELLAAALKDAGISYPFIIGEEITMSYAYHLNCFPLAKKILQEHKGFAELVAEAREQGAVIMLNHPMAYGKNLRSFWYSAPFDSGIDVFERNIGRREDWRNAGYEGAFLGSTDSHWGIFAHYA